ncbi:MAG: hypothetical protein H0X62_00600 [Bacteroidetes bacterium]|nr:hypothetical protein [Bacteroidota bacterium]
MKIAVSLTGDSDSIGRIPCRRLCLNIEKMVDFREKREIAFSLEGGSAGTWVCLSRVS